MLEILTGLYTQRFCLHIHSYFIHPHFKKKFYLLSPTCPKPKISACSWGSMPFNFKILNYMQTSQEKKGKSNPFLFFALKNAWANLFFSCWFLKEPFHQEVGAVSRSWLSPLGWHFLNLKAATFISADLWQYTLTEYLINAKLLYNTNK